MAIVAGQSGRRARAAGEDGRCNLVKDCASAGRTVASVETSSRMGHVFILPARFVRPGSLTLASYVSLARARRSECVRLVRPASPPQRATASAANKADYWRKWRLVERHARIFFAVPSLQIELVWIDVDPGAAAAFPAATSMSRPVSKKRTEPDGNWHPNVRSLNGGSWQGEHGVLGRAWRARPR